MASASPAIVMYAGSAATYVCEGGDVQPTYPLLPCITEEFLKALLAVPTQHIPSSSATDAACSSPGASASSLPTRHLAAGTATNTQHRKALGIRSRLASLLHRRLLFLVLPLASSRAYREDWVRLCFQDDVDVCQLIVVSDTVADSFACGRPSCVVVHASLNGVTLSRVDAGCSTRYSNTHVGALRAICGEAATAALTEQLPLVAAAAAVDDAERLLRQQEDSDEDADESIESLSMSTKLPLMVDLGEEKYRDALVHAFGYEAYRAVVVAPQQRRLDAQSRAQSKGKGKGKGRASRSGGNGPPTLLKTLQHAYPKEVRTAPGQLAKLLARIVHGGASFSATEGTEPCILAGEALAVPYMKALYSHVIAHCGETVWLAAEKEKMMKQRERASHRSSDAGTMAGAAASTPASPAAPQRKRHRLDEEDTTATSSSSSSVSDSSSETSEEETSDSGDEEVWLHHQPSPLPTAPWWMPLLGASVLSRLSEQDVQRAAITTEEARETNGAVVHWKMLL